jgi:NTF2 fold immunity protein
MIGAQPNGGTMKILAALCACLLVPVAIAGGQSYKPPAGFVPAGVVAVQIAEAVLIPIYGKEQIDSEKPFTANLRGDVWTVLGTLRCPDGNLCDGGVAVVRISKTDARILSVMHGK